MTQRNFSSTAAVTALAAPINDTQTTMNVAATTGLPAAPFTLTVDTGAVSQELVLVTNVAGTTLTVTRGYDSTSAQAHLAGAVVTHSHAGIDFREANLHVNATTGVHGVTGAVVGTTDTQTLSNKTLASSTTFPTTVVSTTGTQTLTNKTVALGSNTVSGTTAQFNTALSDNDFATLAGTETLTNKTLTSPRVGSGILDVNGVTLLGAQAVASAVNNLKVVNNTAGLAPQLLAEGSDTNISINLVPKGTGTLKQNSVDVATTTGTQTLTNKTLTSPAINGATVDATTTIGGGTTLGAWTSFTPTLTGITLGNGTLTGRYMQIGKMVVGSVYFAAGTTTTYSATTLAVSLPVTMQSTNLVAPGTVRCDNGSNATRFVGDLIPATTTTVNFEFPGVAPASNTVPFTWGTGSKFGFTFTYEAA